MGRWGSEAVSDDSPPPPRHDRAATASARLLPRTASSTAPTASRRRRTPSVIWSGVATPKQMRHSQVGTRPLSSGTCPNHPNIEDAGHERRLNQRSVHPVSMPSSVNQT